MAEGINPSGEQTQGIEEHGLAWLESQPHAFWEERPEISKPYALSAGRAFARGATTPFVFDVWNQALAFYLPANKELPKEKEVGDFINIRERVSDQFLGYMAAGNKREAERVIGENLAALGREYKIHVQPTDEHLEDCLQSVAGFLSGDQVARETISSVKVQAYPKRHQGDRDSRGNFVPMIIIYPYLGRDVAHTLILKLAFALADKSSWGTGNRPGYNVELTKLLYLTQSDRSLKNKLANAGLLDKFFDSSVDHAFVKGEKHYWQDVLPSKPPFNPFGVLRRR